MQQVCGPAQQHVLPDLVLLALGAAVRLTEDELSDRVLIAIRKTSHEDDLQLASKQTK